MALVAIAGPATNVALASVSAALFHVLGSLPAHVAAWLGQTLYQSILLNLLLAILTCFRSRHWMEVGLLSLSCRER